jgi:hypothetical protein
MGTPSKEYNIRFGTGTQLTRHEVSTCGQKVRKAASVSNKYIGPFYSFRKDISYHKIGSDLNGKQPTSSLLNFYSNTQLCVPEHGINTG